MICSVYDIPVLEVIKNMHLMCIISKCTDLYGLLSSFTTVYNKARPFMAQERAATLSARGRLRSKPVVRSRTSSVNESLSLSYMVYAMKLWSGDTSESSSYEYPVHQTKLSCRLQSSC